MRQVAPPVWGPLLLAAAAVLSCLGYATGAVNVTRSEFTWTADRTGPAAPLVLAAQSPQTLTAGGDCSAGQGDLVVLGQGPFHLGADFLVIVDDEQQGLHGGRQSRSLIDPTKRQSTKKAGRLRGSGAGRLCRVAVHRRPPGCGVGARDVWRSSVKDDPTSWPPVTFDLRPLTFDPGL